nr:uncharacterized protein LOC112001554 [Quercus suber]
MVSSLIDNDTKWWKPNLVKSLFLPFEASTILSIPISFSLPKDSLILLGNKNGPFTVKSAYYIAAKLVEQGEHMEGTSNCSALPLWRKIWQLKVPPKVKIFAWRACMNGLPTLYNLRCKGLNFAGFCSLCDKCMETTTYALIHCEHARATWALWLDCPFNFAGTAMDTLDVAG